MLDLMAGQVVRAARGDRAAYRPIVSTVVEGSAPSAVAAALLACAPPPPGDARVLYVADLDAIQGGAAQREVLAGLLALAPDLELWLDAGFRDVAAARTLAAALGEAGKRLRPVYGSESLADAAALAAVGRDPRAILSLDCRHGRPLDPSGSWQQPDLWPRTLVVMTLDRVGAGEGPDLAQFHRLRALAPDRTWVGAGGLRDEADLCAAAASGAAAWLVASALHDGSLRLA